MFSGEHIAPTMKNNSLLSASFLVVSAAFGVAGLEGAAVASITAGLVLIFLADYGTRPAPSLTQAPADSRLPVGPESGATRPARVPGYGAWAGPRPLQRRLVDGPVY